MQTGDGSVGEVPVGDEEVPRFADVFTEVRGAPTFGNIGIEEIVQEDVERPGDGKRATEGLLVVDKIVEVCIAGMGFVPRAPDSDHVDEDDPQRPHVSKAGVVREPVGFFPKTV